MAVIVNDNWTGYFHHNEAHLMPIDWHSDYQLTTQERETILSSLQQFQLGESSDGKHFIELAERYVEQSGDVGYLPALKLFIKEEQRHARDLGRFMQQQGLPLVEHHPVDGLFRVLRHLMNLEMAIVVLLTAEVVAMTYYKALHDATQSPALRDLCRQILRDEVQHLNFQSETLHKTRLDRSRMGRWMTHMIERVFIAGTLLVVWYGHGRVYRAGGFSFKKYWRVNFARANRTFGGTACENISCRGCRPSTS